MDEKLFIAIYEGGVVSFKGVENLSKRIESSDVTYSEVNLYDYDENIYDLSVQRRCFTPDRILIIGWRKMLKNELILVTAELREYLKFLGHESQPNESFRDLIMDLYSIQTKNPEVL